MGAQGEQQGVARLWSASAQGQVTLLRSFAVWLPRGPGDISEDGGWSPSPPGSFISHEFYYGLLPTL